MPWRTAASYQVSQPILSKKGAPWGALSHRLSSIAKSGKAVYMLQAHAKIPKPRVKPEHKKYEIKQKPGDYLPRPAPAIAAAEGAPA